MVTCKILLKNSIFPFFFYMVKCIWHVPFFPLIIQKRGRLINRERGERRLTRAHIKHCVTTYSRLESGPVSSPSMRYTFPCMTYSKLSAREGPVSVGLYSPSSGVPSSLSVLARTIRNLSPVKHSTVLFFALHTVNKTIVSIGTH